MAVPYRRDRPLRPLDAPALERLALRYVERFATTRGKLADYLTRKLRERGWDGEGTADPAGVAARMASLGYVDDRAYAEAKAAAMTRRGLGARRVTGALRQARVSEDDAVEVTEALDAGAREAAITLARRRRLGPWGAPVDRAARERQLAVMLRAGHGLGLARMVIDAKTPEELDESDPVASQNRCGDDEAC